jgi:hypothetical protein
MIPQGKAEKERKGEIDLDRAGESVGFRWFANPTASQKNAIAPFRRKSLRDDRKWAMPGTTFLNKTMLMLIL